MRKRSMRKRSIAIAADAACLFLQTARARPKPAADSPKPAGFRGEFLTQMEDVEKKLSDLAEAMPESSYSWRPMEGVRSVSEVYMHIAGANYMFPTLVGINQPEGTDWDLKNVTGKKKVLEALKLSFDHIREAVMKTPDGDLDKPVKMFGQETTKRGVFFVAALHMHEHLGQSIAYARMNKIVPPWTAAEQARQKSEKK